MYSFAYSHTVGSLGLIMKQSSFDDWWVFLILYLRVFSMSIHLLNSTLKLHSRAQGYKTFLMLNLAENEICSAYKK